MTYEQVVAMVRDVALALDRTKGDMFAIGFDARRLAGETRHWLRHYIEADEKANYGAHSPRAMFLFRAHQIIENATREVGNPSDYQIDRAANMIALAVDELPGVADALEAMAPELVTQPSQPSHVEHEPTAEAKVLDPWVLHWRRMRDAGATHKDIAKAWKDDHPEELMNIEQLTKRSKNEVSRQKPG